MLVSVHHVYLHWENDDGGRWEGLEGGVAYDAIHGPLPDELT